MKNYFSAILLGSLFSCSLLPIGIVDEPDTLIDPSSEPDVIAVDYERYDQEHGHYFVHLTWTDYADNEWSQRGRLAKFKKNFHPDDRRKLMDLVSFDRKQIFYFLARHEPDLVSRPRKKARRARRRRSTPPLPRSCPLRNSDGPVASGPNKIPILIDSSDDDDTVKDSSSDDAEAPTQ